MISLPSHLGNGTVLRWGNDTLIDFVTICIEHSLFLIPPRDLFPQGLRALAAPVPHVEGEDLARQSIHSNPHPLPVCFPADEAPELVYLVHTVLMAQWKSSCNEPPNF